jgi:hypothetical protein
MKYAFQMAGALAGTATARAPDAGCTLPSEESHAFMRVHRDNAWAPDNSVP